MENSNTNESKSTSGATTAIILSCVSLIAWIIPLIGFPVAIIGITFGIKYSNYTRSLIAIAFCIVSLIASSINAYIGASNYIDNNNENSNSSSQSYTPSSSIPIINNNPNINVEQNETYTNNQYSLESYITNFQRECLKASNNNYSYCACTLANLTETYNIEQLYYWENNGYPDETLSIIVSNCS